METRTGVFHDVANLSKFAKLHRNCMLVSSVTPSVPVSSSSSAETAGSSYQPMTSFMYTSLNPSISTWTTTSVYVTSANVTSTLSVNATAAAQFECYSCEGADCNRTTSNMTKCTPSTNDTFGTCFMKYDLVKSLRTLSCVSVFVGRTNCTRHLGRYSDGNHTCEYCCMTHLCNVETIESELASDCLTKLGPVKSSAMTLTAFTWWPFVALGVLLLIAAIGDRWSRLENADFLAIAAPLSF